MILVYFNFVDNFLNKIEPQPTSAAFSNQFFQGRFLVIDYVEATAGIPDFKNYVVIGNGNIQIEVFFWITVMGMNH